MSVGVVVIGRNEGQRLRRCLESLPGQEIVYVDSGSSDDSAKLAESFGAEVIRLAPPFTAARARNEGVARLRARGFRHAQLLDGDCQLDSQWLATAQAHLQAYPRAAIVCGQVRERRPEASVYNRLCDQEWRLPPGPALECGGNALVDIAAFVGAGGFAPELIAGEEPDLCFRLIVRGREVWRVDAPMVSHDAAMTRFSQWWRRNRRSGYARAEAFERHGERRILRAVISNVVWALPPAWLLWPLLWWRIYRRRRDPLYAAFTVLGKLPHFQGQLQFWLGRRGRLIEYK